MNLFVNVYNNKYEGVIDTEHVNLDITAASMNFSSQFTFKKGWKAELSAFYNTKDLVSSNILAEPMGMFSFGGSKSILKNKGTVKVNVRDPFYLMRFHGTTDLNNFTADITANGITAGLSSRLYIVLAK
jgi:hypothetical protein